ncbi:MAG: 23S rRNA (pseudouridine(1915)-N(3))-methyltransferase RlmH [Roseburia sp.]|nr:23S rRNA (pseudouridine(1915)-N(3))-methyltransferase RlmH [Ruminococcus sp.]MCM1154633.1 23S rRNA (pseudouridine(1915)-N(3))-methyltransferase RlmH [Roseburia sp.]MCM1242624.1 23S rRNA (pseudouridine(1915)-N(3))-methyltransferase RlmH [Roseburia sp.]
MKITIITVGKIKEKYIRDAISEYTKRLKNYVKLEIIQVEDEPVPENAGCEERDQIKAKEADRILKHIKDKEGSYLITLDIIGISMNSEDFAAKIEKLMAYGVSHIQFVIGGSLGLHSKVCNRANLSLSFSKMTFPHQLMRVILLEQIYRSYRIIRNEPYHK